MRQSKGMQRTALLCLVLLLQLTTYRHPTALCPPPALRSQPHPPSVEGGGGGTPLFAPCPPLSAPTPTTLPVDLLLKLSPHHGLLCSHLFTSLRLLWPSYTRITLVVDDANSTRRSAHAFAAVPRSVILEEPLGQVGNSYDGQMWSNFYADEQTGSAPFIAILDCDAVIRARVDRAAFVTPQGGLVVRYLPCHPPSPLPPNNVWHFAGPCRYNNATEWLLRIPRAAGNFMVAVPMVLNRGLFPALRAHVEAAHGKPFRDVMEELFALMASQDMGLFSQQSVFGAFLAAFPEVAGAELDGGDEVGGVAGYALEAWGVAPSHPLVGSHLSQLKDEVEPREYSERATAILHRGLCWGYNNVARALCDDGDDGGWRWEFEGQVAPVDARAAGSHPWGGAMPKRSSCFGGA